MSISAPLEQAKANSQPLYVSHVHQANQPGRPENDLIDARPQAIAQRRLQDIANCSHQVAQLQALGRMAQAGALARHMQKGVPAKNTSQLKHQHVDLSGEKSGATATMSRKGNGPVLQRASMLVLIGSTQDMLDLAGNTKLEEKNLNLKSVKLAGANLGAIGADDILYLSGAHGDSSSYGPYGSGQDLVNALFAKGLRVCKSIWLTGCETGNSFAGDFYDKAITKGIDIKEYITAPKTYGGTRDGGRLTAETPEGMQVRKLKGEKAKLDVIELLFGTKAQELQKQIDDIVNKPGYWEEIENPVQLAEEVGEMYDSLDRCYSAYTSENPPDGSFDYATYEKEHQSVRDTYNPRLKKATEVWAVHGKESTKTAFLSVYNRKPIPRKIWDLSGFF